MYTLRERNTGDRIAGEYSTLEQAIHAARDYVRAMGEPVAIDTDEDGNTIKVVNRAGLVF